MSECKSDREAVVRAMESGFIAGVVLTSLCFFLIWIVVLVLFL